MWIEVIRDLIAVCEQLLSRVEQLEEENKRLLEQDKGYDTVH